MIVGTAVATVFVAMLMRRVGRRTGFVAGALIAAAGGMISAYGLYIESFVLFCFGVGLWGVNNAFVQQYRFAAAESVAKELTSRAISLVLLGAIGGAFFGPLLATVGQHWIAADLYMGSMIAIAVLQAIAVALLLGLEEPVSESIVASAEPSARCAASLRNRRISLRCLRAWSATAS